MTFNLTKLSNWWSRSCTLNTRSLVHFIILWVLLKILLYYSKEFLWWLLQLQIDFQLSILNGCSITGWIYYWQIQLCNFDISPWYFSKFLSNHKRHSYCFHSVAIRESTLAFRVTKFTWSHVSLWCHTMWYIYADSRFVALRLHQVHFTLHQFYLYTPPSWNRWLVHFSNVSYCRDLEKKGAH